MNLLTVSYSLRNIEQFKLYLSSSLYTTDNLSFVSSERYIFLINIPVPLLQFPNQITFRDFAITEQTVLTDIITQHRK